MATTIISHALCCAEKISETNDDKNSCANISDKDLEIFMGALCSAHIHVMFNTTYYCDLMCPHCHYACNTKSQNFMSEYDIYAILDELKANSFLIASVNFSGGEITTIEDKHPGYIKHLLSKSLEYGFDTSLMTNGSFIQKPYAKRLLSDLCDIYISAKDKFHIQMSFDQYHKNCIPNAHKLINELDQGLQNANGNKYDLFLMGFKHNPDFRNNLNTAPKYINVFNKLAYDLNPVGRAKDNNLPDCQDTYTKFAKSFNGDKFQEMVFTPMYFKQDADSHYALNTIMTFDCNGYVNLADAHNPENINKFKTTYKNPNGTFKILPEIHADLALKLINHFYGNGK